MNFLNALNLIGIPIWLFVIATIWSLVWKGLALWKSAKLNSPIWFILILVFNTMGILEILYIFLFSKIKLEKKPTKRKSKSKSKKKRKSKKQTPYFK